MYNIVKCSIKYCITYNGAAKLFNISFMDVIKLNYLVEERKCLNENGGLH